NCSAPALWTIEAPPEKYGRRRTDYGLRRDGGRCRWRKSSRPASRACPPRTGCGGAALRLASASGEGAPGPAAAARHHRRADRPPAGPGRDHTTARRGCRRGAGLARSGPSPVGTRALRARRPPPRLFVNDRLDVALAVGAAGVQLGQGSLTPADACRLNPRWWIGKSVHDLREAEAAHAGGADYLLVGPVFPTATHPDRAPLGSARLKEIA